MSHTCEPPKLGSMPAIKRQYHHIVCSKDSSYSRTVWNLSQNVDRQIGSGRLGIAPCLTPTMIAYITNRGGPLVGIEALGLQGLPVDRLLLTRETQDQLADLAGNAMSTTVVGSAMVLALIISVPILEKSLEDAGGGNAGPMDVDVETVTGRPLYTSSLDDRISGLEQLQNHPLELAGNSDLSWSEFLKVSMEAKRWCRCEGRSTVSDRTMRQCFDCGSTACVKCGQRPEHSYKPVTFENPRPQPFRFSEEAKKLLPMALTFKNVPNDETLSSIRKSSGAGDIQFNLWKAWKEAVFLAMSMQLSFVDLKRQEIWVAVYESPYARLELHINHTQPQWRLFALPDPLLSANDPVRDMLSAPVARMLCQDEPLKGQWEYAIPGKTAVKLVIRGIGEGEDALVDSWEKSLGLTEARFAEKMVWKRIKIDYKDAPSSIPFDRDISGTYQYLPKCGTASNSLHKQVKDASGRDVDFRMPTIFFFLDPTRAREASWDSFVFSSSMRRYEYEETRPIIAKLEPSWRQNDRKITEAECSVNWKWVSARSLSFKVRTSLRSLFPYTYALLDRRSEGC